MQYHNTPISDDEQLKTCTRCGMRLTLDRFFARSKTDHRLRGHCKDCHRKGASPQSRWVVLTISLRQHGKSPGARELRQALGEPTECYLCGGDLTWDTAAADHVLPVSRGGTNDVSNLRWAHRRCNRYKSDRTLDELIEHSRIILLRSQQPDFPSS